MPRRQGQRDSLSCNLFYSFVHASTSSSDFLSKYSAFGIIILTELFFTYPDNLSRLIAPPFQQVSVCIISKAPFTFSLQTPTMKILVSSQFAVSTLGPIWHCISRWGIKWLLTVKRLKWKQSNVFWRGHRFEPSCASRSAVWPVAVIA